MTGLMTGAMTLIACRAVAQTSGSGSPSARPTAAADAGLATPTGHEVSAGIASYTYREPGSHAISIHGPKFVGEYTGTLSLDQQRYWFLQAQILGTVGKTAYDGWCSPFVITPDSASPNGYALDLGSPSPCRETGDRDWYVEARALARKDLIVRRSAWSPYTGLGLRHLSNGTTGVPGFRTDDYLYLPAGMTARTNRAWHGALAFNVEFDLLIHGWQKTRNSALGGGDVPATTRAPAFTINGFTDTSFSQARGWALRAGVKYSPTRRWSLEPSYVRWSVGASPVNYETATFTVNGVAAREQLGFYEPFNTTSEFGVRLGFHF